MGTAVLWKRLSTLCALAALCVFPVQADGGYFSEKSVAVSADQRAILIRNGDEISMTLSTGYTGDGAEFAWIIPTPAVPDIGDVKEAGEAGEEAFRLLDELTAPVLTSGSGGCFPAGTEVLTRDGPRPIESVREDAALYTYDFSADEWVFRPVRRRLSHDYSGELVTISFGYGSFEATANHPIFVVGGEELGARPRPRDLPAVQAVSLPPGRWVEAGDILAGDRLRSLHGTTVTVSAVSRRSGVLTVYNLEVAGGESYAVHRAGILVHNKGQAEGEEPQKLVTVYGSVTLEHYEVNVVGAEDPDALLGWLDDNGYRVSPAAHSVLADYIGRGWAFVAVKLNPGERRRYENELLPPLTIEYRHSKLIFPLRISSVSTAEAARITLYVIAESTVSSSNFKTRPLSFDEEFDEERHDLRKYVEAGIKQTVGAKGRGLAVLWKGLISSGPSESFAREPDRPYQKLVYDLMADPPPLHTVLYLTRLNTILPPAAMTEDIVLKLNPAPYRFGRVDVRTHGQSRRGGVREVSGLPEIVAVAAGWAHSVALAADGTVWGWGRNRAGQLGDGTAEHRATPAPVRGLSGATAVAAGSFHTVALKEDGTVWTWGNNSSGELGDGTTEARSLPQAVPGLADITAVAADGSFTMALKRDGTVWCWGSNTWGQLGDGTRKDSNVPVRVRGITRVAAIAAGATHAVALSDTGRVRAWGRNAYGQLGTVPLVDRRIVRVPGAPRIAAISAGDVHTVALARDGTVWSWGYNSRGQLGDGTGATRREPVKVTGLPLMAAVSAGQWHTAAIAKDGSLWAWGRNDFGELGNSRLADCYTPVRIKELSSLVQISAGYSSTLGVREDGTVLEWGHPHVIDTDG